MEFSQGVTVTLKGPGWWELARRGQMGGGIAGQGGVCGENHTWQELGVCVPAEVSLRGHGDHRPVGTAEGVVYPAQWGLGRSWSRDCAVRLMSHEGAPYGVCGMGGLCIGAVVA